MIVQGLYRDHLFIVHVFGTYYEGRYFCMKEDIFPLVMSCEKKD